MDFSKVKMVVTDMDGTLLNSNHEVSNRFFELFYEIKKKGIHFVAASGRQYHSIIDKLKPIKNDIIVISENGGLAIEKNTEIVSTPLPNDKKNKIIKTLELVPNIHPVLCGKDNAYLRGNSDAFLNKLREFYSEFEIVDDLKTFDGEILKIAIYHFEDSEKYIYPFVKHFEGDMKVKISGQNWVDISSPNANKGYALQKVMDMYHLKPHEIIVFGDYNNDLEMLALSDFSFAMENAHPNVKKAANYTTKSNDNFGVEHILERLLY